MMRVTLHLDVDPEAVQQVTPVIMRAEGAITSDVRGLIERWLLDRPSKGADLSPFLTDPAKRAGLMTAAQGDRVIALLESMDWQFDVLRRIAVNS